MSRDYNEIRKELMSALNGLTVSEGKTYLMWCEADLIKMAEQDSKQKIIRVEGENQNISLETNENLQRNTNEIRETYKRVDRRNRLSLVLSGVSLGITIGYVLAFIIL